MREPLLALNLFLFGIGLLGILSVFALYPLFLRLVSLGKERGRPFAGGPLPSVSMLVAVRNGEAFVASKIDNAFSLDYPQELFELILVSDGSSDGTEEVLRSIPDPRLKSLCTAEHHGKAAALNRGIRECSSEVVVFSDADALLERDVLRKLVRHYSDPGIGGVCGQRVIYDRPDDLKKAQSRYIKFDSMIKALESRLESITSNDGKLYSIRRKLFQPIDSTSTDDLYVSLGVVRRGYRFIFEPEARAYVRLPARSPSHEVQRRRRIVSRSLRGIFLMRDLLNPFRHGVFSIGLLINKVVRRFLPVCLLLLFFSSAFLSQVHPIFLGFLLIQAALYCSAVVYPVISRTAVGKRFGRAAALPVYFCLGNLGTLLGLLDFLQGRKVSKWDPLKVS